MACFLDNFIFEERKDLQRIILEFIKLEKDMIQIHVDIFDFKKPLPIYIELKNNI